jgi:hypothetical protein
MNQSNQKSTGSKLLSGRLWLTAICGISFLIFVITFCSILYVKRDIFSGSELVTIMNVILLIISNTMTFYFTKNRDDMVIEKKNNADIITNNLSSVTGKNQTTE